MSLSFHVQYRPINTSSLISCDTWPLRCCHHPGNAVHTMKPSDLKKGHWETDCSVVSEAGSTNSVAHVHTVLQVLFFSSCNEIKWPIFGAVWFNLWSRLWENMSPSCKRGALQQEQKKEAEKSHCPLWIWSRENELGSVSLWIFKPLSLQRRTSSTKTLPPPTTDNQILKYLSQWGDISSMWFKACITAHTIKCVLHQDILSKTTRKKIRKVKLPFIVYMPFHWQIHMFLCIWALVWLGFQMK